MSEPTSDQLFDYLLRLGDDALIAAQRLGEWYASSPEMEEDIALANIALDQLGAARALLTYAGEIEGAGRDEDALAYLRDDRGFRNCLLVELPNSSVGGSAGGGASRGDDFAVAIAKLLFLSAYQLPLYDALVSSSDARLAEIAAKARKESAYHLDHAARWTLRLGDGTEESHRRMQAAVDAVWPYVHELLAADETATRLASSGLAADPAELRAAWLSTVEPLLAEATLDRPADGWAPEGGRVGRHTEHLSYLLGEMQVLHRAHPGARW